MAVKAGIRPKKQARSRWGIRIYKKWERHPGCEKRPEPVEFTTFAMDTVMNFTLYGEKKQTADAVKSLLTGEVSALEGILSATQESSEIARLNRRGTGGVSAETAGVLAKALELCEVTGGALDVTAYPAVKSWGFTQEERETLCALLDRVIQNLKEDAQV